MMSPFLGLYATAQESSNYPNPEVSARSFVDSAQVVSKYASERYAHQSSLRMVKGRGYAVYQCNESSTDENAAGQIARMAIFEMLAPAATAHWVDISQAGDSSNGITITGKFVSAPMIHRVDDDTLRVFFISRMEGDADPASRVFYKDYILSTGKLSGLHIARCTIAKDPGTVLDLAMPAVQKHLSFLFGAGAGDSFSRGISTACDFVEIDGVLYSTIQAKKSENGKTLLLTNILMRSHDNGATWELLGAPDPKHLPGDVKILAEPVITHDKKNLYLHLRSNVADSGYVLTKTPLNDLFAFDPPVTKWTYGIGRPAICDFGKPIGIVAMFTAQSVAMGGAGVSRNKCDVVHIDPSYSRYTLVFSAVDYNAVNTPFICPYNDEMYVTYTTGKRRLTPKFGTSEIVFTKLKREFFVKTQP